MKKALKPIFRGILCGLSIFIITHVVSILHFFYNIPGALLLVVLSGVVTYFCVKKGFDSFALTTISIYAALIVVVLFFDNAATARYFEYIRFGVYTRCPLMGLGFLFTLALSLICSALGLAIAGIQQIKKDDKA